MATPISSHVKDESGIFTARDEDMIFYFKENLWYFISIYIIIIIVYLVEDQLIYALPVTCQKSCISLLIFILILLI